MLSFLIPTAHAALGDPARTAGEASTNGTLTLIGLLFNSAGYWVAATVVFVLSLILASALKRYVIGRITRRSQFEVHKEVLILAGRSVYFGCLIVGGVVALSILGIEITAILGFVGFGVGFALKDILSNIIAGVVILTQKKFQIGDIVQIGTHFGIIKDIDIRVSEIRSFDGTTLLIPNAEMVMSVIQNYTAGDVRRRSFQVSVHYKSDLSQVIPYTVKSVEKVKSVLKEPKTQVLAKEFGDSAIVLEVRYWIEVHDNWPVIESQVIQQVKADFDAAGITIPFPIRTLAMDPYDERINAFVGTEGKK